MNFATARAHPNIAFIKYWGNQDERLRLPANPSLSMNLDGMFTETTVRWDRDLASDQLTLDGEIVTGPKLARVSEHLGRLRQRLGLAWKADVVSSNNFPTGAGIASSASAFAALTLAATCAAGFSLPERELSAMARLGSGSAARSIPAGFVEWHTGSAHEESFAESFAPEDYWPLIDVIAIVSKEHKRVGSTEGHRTAATSDLQPARLSGAGRRLLQCKQAILDRDFKTFAEVVEHDSNLMHAVMMTSLPPLFYWLPATLAVMSNVRRWREAGINVCYTLDAGPNVHCICLAADAPRVRDMAMEIEGVEAVRTAGAGGAARLVDTTAQL